MPDRRVTASGRRATDALKMACPFCGGSSSAVVNSRGQVGADRIRRRRECADCGRRFPTSELVDYECLQRELLADQADQTTRSLRETTDPPHPAS